MVLDLGRRGRARPIIFTTLAFFIFFPIVFGVHWLLRRHDHRKMFLLAASYFFYGWWDWRYLFLILASSLTDYLVGIALENVQEQRKRKWLLWTSLTVNLSLLGWFKYFNFFVESAYDLLNALGFEASFTRLDIILPVGISFYTFQTLSYTIEVYQRKLPATRSFVDFFLFVSFFPQLVAGPIVRASEFLPQLPDKKYLTSEKFFSGVERFMIGAFKKLVLGDTLAPLVDGVFGAPNLCSSGEILMGMVGFCFQVYGDFSGYSDMAMGAARMLGYELPVNFRLPFLSLSITDFWRRWHITMGAWFRDYVYIPLGGNRGSKLRTQFNLIVTFVVTGLWHGAAWPFVVYGFWNGIGLALEREWNWWKERRGIPRDRRLIPKLVCFVIVTLSTIGSFGVFRCPDMKTVYGVFGRLFSGVEGAGVVVHRQFWFLFAIGVIYHVLAAFEVHNRIRGLLTTPARRVFWRGVIYTAFVLLMLSFAPMGSKGFLYFQF